MKPTIVYIIIKEPHLSLLNKIHHTQLINHHNTALHQPSLISISQPKTNTNITLILIPHPHKLTTKHASDVKHSHLDLGGGLLPRWPSRHGVPPCLDVGPGSDQLRLRRHHQPRAMRHVVEIREGELISGEVLAPRKTGLVHVQDFGEVSGERLDGCRVCGHADDWLDEDLEVELGDRWAEVLGLGFEPGFEGR